MKIQSNKVNALWSKPVIMPAVNTGQPAQNSLFCVSMDAACPNRIILGQIVVKQSLKVLGQRLKSAAESHRMQKQNSSFCVFDAACPNRIIPGKIIVKQSLKVLSQHWSKSAHKVNTEKKELPRNPLHVWKEDAASGCTNQSEHDREDV